MRVVADASPLIALSRIGIVYLVQKLFQKIVIPKAVYNDIFIKGRRKPGDKEVRQALQDGWIIKKTPAKLLSPPYQGMHKGEIEVLSLSLEIKADFIVIDEGPARKRAQQEGIPCIGTLDLLLQAKRKGIISDARSHLLALYNAGFYMSQQVVEYVLEKSGEK